MGIFSFLKNDTEKKDIPKISSFLPQEIYQSGTLELQDIIAPPALKVTPREIHLGDKIL